MPRIIFLLVMLHLGVAAVALVMMTGFVWAHQSPTGWAYGIECCSNKDCRQEANTAVTVQPGGYRVEATGELIPYKDRRIKRSRDEFYHRCALGGKFDAPRSLCLYVPDVGF